MDLNKLKAKPWKWPAAIANCYIDKFCQSLLPGWVQSSVTSLPVKATCGGQKDRKKMKKKGILKMTVGRLGT